MADRRRDARLLSAVTGAILIPSGLVLLLVPYVILRLAVGQDPQTWCFDRAPEWVDFPPGEGYSTSWDISLTGITCIYGSDPVVESFFDMGSWIAVAGLAAILLALVCGVIVIVLTRSIVRADLRR